MHVKRITRKTPWTAADRARHKAIRERFQKKKPTMDQLFKDGELQPLGVYFALRQAAHRLKNERKKAGVSLAQLAKRTGIDKAALSRLENGKHPNPTLETLTRYADGLGKELCFALREKAAG